MMEEIQPNSSNTDADDDRSDGLSTPPPEPSDSWNENLENKARLIELEEEQERLNNSLLALTTHFAQVQFRLKQICNANVDEKEILLKELEEFTFKGCPDITEVKKNRKDRNSVHSAILQTNEHESIVEKQRQMQLQLIKQLKDQLEDLERFAYETGEAGLPTSQILEKQKLIIDELMSKMEFKADFESLSPQELQWQVDQAIKRLINPIKVKEQLVQQLQTQITDLERFIDFLQEEGAVGGNFVKCSCKNLQQGSSKESEKSCPVHSRSFVPAKRIGYEKPIKKDTKTSTLFASTLSLIQIYILAQLGCRSEKFYRNQLKHKDQGRHYGDFRAALEMAIDRVVAVASKFKQAEQRPATLAARQNSDDEELENDVFENCPEELVSTVRKELCPALRDLLQHGTLPAATNSSSMLSSLACLSSRSKVYDEESNVHAWEIIYKYYDLKHGKEFSNDPVRRLSQSFNLDNIGGRAVTSKQLLLSTIDNVASSHARLKRSQDAMFKAFVCAALNHRKLVGWLRMILRTKEIMDEYYTSWSYVVKTGFDDACTSLERFNSFAFNLPMDLAVRPFQNIKDVF